MFWQHLATGLLFACFIAAVDYIVWILTSLP